MNNSETGFSWRKSIVRALKVTADAAVGGIPPVAVAAEAFVNFPRQTVWLIQNQWAMGSLGIVAVLGAGATVVWGVRKLNPDETDIKGLAVEIVSSTSLAGIATVAFLEIAKNSMAGNGEILLAMGATAVGVGAVAAYALSKRVQYRAGEEEIHRIQLGRQEQNAAVKGKVENHLDGRAEGIAKGIYAKIASKDGAVSRAMQEHIERLAREIAKSDIKRGDASHHKAMVVKAAEVLAERSRRNLVNEDGSINSEIAEQFVTPRIKAKQSR